MKKPKKVNNFFYIILIFIPIFFFIILELSLRTFNYGIDTSTWQKITESYYGLNPEIARRYFYTVKTVPESIQDVFAIEKKPNTFRVFILGGSSAAGYPYMPLGSFSRYIRQRLELNYPNQNIEVINLSLTAVNSYTIRDLIPDVLDQQPDLILIYAGHNEYYGALGVGSMESLGQSRTIVNFVLSLNKFKTTQLFRDLIKLGISIFKDTDASASGTLMSRMAQNQKIEYGSNTFNLGIEQFKGNMSDVINMVKEKNIPIILSTLASNLKDQKPFISDSKNKDFNADLIFSEARKNYQNADFKTADSLFRVAKDYDQLRFRAPEKINKVIFDLGKKYNVPVLDAESLISAECENGIIGNEIMIDHLHLTLNGYRDLGKFFFEKMNSLKLLPKVLPKYKFGMQDSLTRRDLLFSILDSTIADFKIKILKNDWPFKNETNRIAYNKLIKQNNFVDSLASKCVNSDIDWHKAHLNLANYYIKKKKLKGFIEEVKILIYQYPIISEYYELLISELINHKMYDVAYKYLIQNYNLCNNQFATKWLGTIELSRRNYKLAIKYMEESFEYNKSDDQVYYNLSGAYSQIAEYKSALDYINKCLKINPNYPGANNLKLQLENILMKKNKNK